QGERGRPSPTGASGAANEAQLAERPRDGASDASCGEVWREWAVTWQIANHKRQITNKFRITSNSRVTNPNGAKRVWNLVLSTLGLVCDLDFAFWNLARHFAENFFSNEARTAALPFFATAAAVRSRISGLWRWIAKPASAAFAALGSPCATAFKRNSVAAG